jgi:drug/metabolite transporter (DMT)-like permease
MSGRIQGMITAIMLVIIVVSNAAGDVFMTKGMKQVGEVSTLRPMALLGIARRVGTNTDFLMGIFSLTVSFFSFLYVLSWADMSFVVPATSLVYVVTLLGAKFFLNEKVDRLRWAGTLLVCLGVAVICIH